MCLITTAEKKSLIKADLLSGAYENNPHGFGIVYAHDNKLFACKRLSNFETFLKLFEIVPDDVPVAIHFRWATHGEKNVDNIHPYSVLDQNKGDPVDIAMMHNGVISGVHTHNDPRSDTACYIDEFLRPIIKENPDIIFNEAFLKLVGRDIGTGNKFLFMHSNGQRTFVNKNSGHTNEKDSPGVWFSNSYSFNTSHRSFKGGSYNHQDNWSYQAYQAWQNRDQYSHRASPSSANNDYKIKREDLQFESSGDFSDELKKAITKVDVSARLLKAHQPNYVMGYGWLMFGTCMIHGGPQVGAMHKELLAERELKRLKEQEDISKVVELAPNKQMEMNFDKSNFMSMTRTEIMEWITEYPRKAAEFLIRYLRMSGGTSVVETWVQQNLDSVTEAIFEFSHYNRINLELINTNKEEEDTIDYMIAM